MKCNVTNERLIDYVSINITLSKYDIGRLLETGSVSIFPEKSTIARNVIITLEEENKEK